MLNTVKLSVFLGQIKVLNELCLEVREDEITGVIGSNGAGKSTFLNTVAGINSEVMGSIEYKGSEILGKAPEAIVRLGISLICQGGRPFRRMTVLENLELGAFIRSDLGGIKEDIDSILQTFPNLKQRLKMPAGNLSGGEQQMLAISRSLMSSPDLIMMDEPTFGLSPLMVKEVGRVINKLRQQGKTILLVEQNAHMALNHSDMGYVMETGRITLSDTAEALLQSEQVKKAYLGE